MAQLDAIGQRARERLDERHAVRERTLTLSREIIRTCANSIRAAHRGEREHGMELLQCARDGVARMRGELAGHAEIYGAGYVHDCQKELSEAAAFHALVAGEEVPHADDLGVETAAHLNGLGEAIGELRRHTLDVMRRGDLMQAERHLATMDEIYYLLATMDYPDALTGGLRRTTDAARGIIEKTRGELTTALRQEELRRSIDQAVAVLRPASGEGPA